MKNILLSFTGFHDPFTAGLIESEKMPGPILSLISAREFDNIYLFSTPNTLEITADTVKAITQRYPATYVQVIKLNLTEPTNYKAILLGLREHLSQILETHSKDNLFVAVASGTPQMHSCWLLLVASGELPAKILHVRPPKFVTPDRPLVSEIDLSSGEFPTVRYLDTDISHQSTELNIQEAKIRAGIIGNHQLLNTALEQAALMARSDAPVLIYGETGTGKDLLAKFIHYSSARAHKPFIVVNCAAIPENLVESTLFGHVRGAFTGATNSQTGTFDDADGGTLLLDEIGDLSIAIQVKLLRVVQDGIVEALGGGPGHKVNVRILGATNHNIRSLIRKKLFREDLFFRLNTAEITLPPLRDRRTDIPKIGLHILDRINGSLGYQKRFTTEALNRLQLHDWPGNVRDLANSIERSVLMSSKANLDADDLLITEPVKQKDPLQALPEPHVGFELDSFMKSARKQLMLRALEIAEGNQSKAAELLGVTPQAVHKFKNSNGRNT